MMDFLADKGRCKDGRSQVPVADYAVDGTGGRGDQAVRRSDPLAQLLPSALHRRPQEDGSQGSFDLNSMIVYDP